MKIHPCPFRFALRSSLLAATVALGCLPGVAQTSPIVATGWDSNTSTSLGAAGRFLNQSSFGPTINNVFYVEGAGIAAMLQQQIAQPAYNIPLANPMDVTSGDCGSFSCTTEYYWWNDILFGQDQLRQRVAYELSKLFVVSYNEVDPRYFPNYLNLLANDAFGNWLTLMHDVTLSPAMGTYLNMADSFAPATGQHANENYARELMQLFSTGTSQLHQDGSLVLDGNGNPIPNYTSAQVQSFALAYTGWTFANNDCSTPVQPNYYWYPQPPGQNCPMVAMPSLHNTDAKTLLNGTVLPAGQSAEQDLDGALSNIFNNPSLPPFVSMRLIQSLVKSNPTPAYVSRVAGVFINDGKGVRGDMAAVITAILMDPEARADDVAGTADPNGGKLRDPILWWTSVARATQVTSSAALPNVTFYDSVFDLWLGNLDQRPHAESSVFSFYSPSYQLQGSTLFAPEFQNENVNTIVWMGLHLQDALDNHFGAEEQANNEFSLNLGPGNPWYGLAAQQGPTALVNALDALMMHGTMTQDMQQAIVQTLQGLDPLTMTRTALYLIASSPQYRVMM